MSEPAGHGAAGFVAGDRVLDAVVQAAVQITGAAAGWLVVGHDDRLQVVAAAGEGAATLLGRTVPSGSGAAGFVVASGQPLALAGGGDEARMAEGVPALLGRTSRAVLCVPCADDNAVLGALELVDKIGGVRFTFDDVEIATVLAGIGAAALAHALPLLSTPSPAELAGDLQRLAAIDPNRYRAVATALDALLAND
jgi:GAF domain-containing protein